MLTLAEDLLLLCLNDEKGSVVSSGSMALPYGLAGAIIMDLSLMKRIEMDGKNVVLSDASLTGDEILDEAIGNIGSSPKSRPIQHWVARPGKLAVKVKERLLERLVQKGILKKEEHHFLWLIPYNRFPEKDSQPEQETRQRLRDVLLGGAEPAERTALQLCLVHGCGLVGEVFPCEDRKGRKEMKAKLKNFAESDLVAKAISDQVAAVMAVVTSSMMASMAATSSAGR